MTSKSVAFMMDKFDENNSGTITFDEFQLVLSYLDLDFTKEEQKILFNAVDTSKDGII